MKFGMHRKNSMGGGGGGGNFNLIYFDHIENSFNSW